MSAVGRRCPLMFPSQESQDFPGPGIRNGKTNAMLENSAQLKLWAGFTHILHIMFPKIPFHSNCQMPLTMYVLRTI